MHPTITIILVRSKHLCLPIPKTGPDSKAPIALPNVLRDWIIVLLSVSSYGVQSLYFEYAIVTAFQEPIEYPN